MAKYLIDVNLPSKFSVWAGEEYQHVININDELKDSEIWEHAKTNNLTIITKDADFSDMVMANNPPPKVIHIKLGNMKMRDFHQLINNIWDDVLNMSNDYKLVKVFKTKLEGID
jgi:predicted nuclease of predicted toxin-antitoxin system